jgi:hypothetical protein
MNEIEKIRLNISKVQGVMKLPSSMYNASIRPEKYIRNFI